MSQAKPLVVGTQRGGETAVARIEQLRQNLLRMQQLLKRLGSIQLIQNKKKNLLAFSNLPKMPRFLTSPSRPLPFTSVGQDTENVGS